MPSHRLFVCRTCAREQRPAPGEVSLGRQLADGLEALLGHGGTPEIELRRVDCLSGCPSPCNVSLRADGKYGLRFSWLGPDDAPAVAEVALAYVASEDGDVPAELWPEALRGKCTVRSPPPTSS